MQGLHPNSSMTVPFSINSAMDCLSSTPKPLAKKLEYTQMEIEGHDQCEVSLVINHSRDDSVKNRRNLLHRIRSVATARTGRTTKLTPVKAEPTRSCAAFGVPIGLIFRNMQLKSRANQLVGFLEQHSVSAKHRAKLIDWMIDVLKVYHQREQTLFRAIMILDQYFSKSHSEIKPEELHLIGCVVMLIASKQEEIQPLSLESIVKSIGKGKFTREQVLILESKILFVTGFQLNIPTLFEICKSSSCFFVFDDGSIDKFFTNSCLLISKMCLMSYDMVNQFTYEEIAAYGMILSMKLLENLKAGFIADSFIRKISCLFELPEQNTMEGLRIIHFFTIDFQEKMPFVKNLQRYYSLAHSS